MPGAGLRSGSGRRRRSLLAPLAFKNSCSAGRVVAHKPFFAIRLAFALNYQFSRAIEREAHFVTLAGLAAGYQEAAIAGYAGQGLDALRFSYGPLYALPVCRIKN
jgi:hypothetical protein